MVTNQEPENNFAPFELGGKRTPMQGIGTTKHEMEYTGNVPFPQQTIISSISAGYAFFKYAIISVTINNAVAFGSEVQLSVRVGSDQIAQYVIPTGQIGQVIYDTVQIGRVFQNAAEIATTHGGFAAGGAASYTISVTAFSSEV
jgi:hypothetical protein